MEVSSSWHHLYRLPVGDNFVGAVFAVGSARIFLLAVPALWYALVAALAAGFAIAAVLDFAHRKPTEFERRYPEGVGVSFRVACDVRQQRLEQSRR